jgi:hypothetical protein
MPMATEHCSNRSSTVEVDGLFTEHHAQFRETIRNGKVAPLGRRALLGHDGRPTNRADPCDQ